MRKTAAAIAFLILFSAYGFCEEGKLTLRDSIEISKKNSESFAIAKAKVEAAEALAGQAFAAFLPTLKLDGSFGRSFQETPPMVIPKDALGTGLPPAEEVRSFSEAREMDGFSYSGTATQNIFVGWRVWNSYWAAALGVDAAKEELKAAEIDLTYNVISSYYGVIKAKKGLELSNESLELAKKHLSQAGVMFNSGVATKADLLRAELEVARSELALSRAKSGVDLANNSFNLIIGRDLDIPVVLNEEDFKIGEITAPDYQEFLKVAYVSRPDWKIANLGEEIADKNTKASKAGYLPAFFLTGTYGYTNSRLEDVKDEFKTNNWNVALVGSWTIFDGLLTPNKVKEMYSKYVEASKQKDLLKKSIAIDVKNACLALNSAVNEIKAAKKAVELSEENYKIAELRYSAGVATNIEVIDAKTMLNTSNLDLLQAEFSYELAKASLNKAVGREVLGAKSEEKPLTEISLSGLVKFIPIEGGFAGFIDESGNKYDIMGSKAAEIAKVIGASSDGKKIKIRGKVRKDVATIHMWGVPLEVTDYKWE